MKYVSRFCILLAASALSGCATQQFGTAFNQAGVSTLVPGKTTKAQLIETFGPLTDTQVSTAKKDIVGKDLASPVVIEYASYYFSDHQASAARPTMWASRVLNVSMVNSTLSAYRYSSAFAADSTDFDEAKVSKISKGSTEAEVLALMGTPTGRAIYPLCKDPDGTAISYVFKGYQSQTRKLHTKIYTVHFDARKLVADFDLKVQDE